MGWTDIQDDEYGIDIRTKINRLKDFRGYNIKEGLRSFRNALADVDRNPIKIATIGDSVTFGSFCSDILTTSWHSRLRKILQDKFGDVGIGTYPTPYNGSLLSLSPWVMSGTWSYSLGAGFSGRFMSANGNTNTATLTFQGTSLDLIYTQGASGAATGTAITIDGTPVTVPNFYNTGYNPGNIQSYTGLSAGSHTLVITAPTTGSCYIETAIAYNPIASTPKGCYVFNLGTPSTKADGRSPYVNKIISGTNAHLYIIAFGINDKVDTTLYFNSMSTLISGLQASGASVLLLPYYAINDTADNVAKYMDTYNKQYQLANQYNCALVDIYERWGESFTLAQASGLMGTGSFNGNAGNDPAHPGDKGHRDIANAIATALIGQI